MSRIIRGGRIITMKTIASHFSTARGSLDASHNGQRAIIIIVIITLWQNHSVEVVVFLVSSSSSTSHSHGGCVRFEWLAGLLISQWLEW